MCTLCKTTTTDTKSRLNEIATLLSKKKITQSHADELINAALGIKETARNRAADAAWEERYRRGRQ
jgi:hypothetical protein